MDMDTSDIGRYGPIQGPSDVPPSIQQAYGSTPILYLPPGTTAPLARGGPAVVIIKIAAAIVSALVEFSKAVDSVGQIATLIAQLIQEVAWLIKRIVTEEFVDSRIRAADTALSAIQYQIRIAALSPASRSYGSDARRTDIK
jgi:hypothetical protein